MRLSVTAIEYTVESDLFRDVDPVDLAEEASARAFQIVLRERLKDAFPKASLFLKWNPNRTGDADVFTVPEDPGAHAKVLEIAGAVRAEKSRWVRRDQPLAATP
ncbi:MAG: hypothetical protein KC619_04320 [Myxococcales bacterium]|nr:hypothetical protein [Myxococcales bacterium]